MICVPSVLIRAFVIIKTRSIHVALVRKHVKIVCHRPNCGHIFRYHTATPDSTKEELYQSVLRVCKVGVDIYGSRPTQDIEIGSFGSHCDVPLQRIAQRVDLVYV